MVSKINFFCQRDIHSVSSNVIASQEVERWQLFITLMYLVKISGEIAVYAYGNASNFKLGEPRCF